MNKGTQWKVKQVIFSSGICGGHVYLAMSLIRLLYNI